jgi:MFS family permease
MRRYSVHELTHKFFSTGVHRDGIRAIYWGNTIRQFAAAAVGLFVPVYVYRVGFTISGDSLVGGLRTLILFLLLARIAIIALSFFVEHIIDSIGFRWTLLISSLFLILKFVFLTLVEREPTFLWIAAIVSGVVTTTYWISRHALFGEDQDEARVGSALGNLTVLSQLTAIFGPVIGGLIASFYGFVWLFRFGLLLSVLSGLPFFFMHHHRRHHPDGLSGFLDKLRDPVNFPLILGWLGRSWDSNLHLNFWPLYVFLIVGGVGKLGIITSLVAVVAMLASYVAGRAFDRLPDKKRMFLTGSGATALLWPIKALARSFLSVFFIDSIDKAINSFYWIPFLSQTYRFSFRRDTVAFFAFREVVWSVGIIVFLLLAFLITFSWSWALVFLLGGLGVLISMNLVFYRGFR